MDEIQRARLLAAMVEVACEHGLAGTTVARVVAHAGVSRRTFYELFEDREECFLAALDGGIARVCGCVVPAYEAGGGWVERIRLGLAALLMFLDEERALGKLLIVGSLGAGAKALKRRQLVLAQVIAVVDEGAREGKTGSRLPPVMAEGVVGGVLSVIHARLLEPDSREFIELASPLVGMIVLPYLGAAVARREIGRPVPRSHMHAGRVEGDPLRELGMRLTYRSVRVLMSLAATPGSSNREVGVAAGISDKGQASKLLARLQRLGLIQNAGLGVDKGAPNAWGLTGKGMRVERALGAENGGGIAESGQRSKP